MAKYMIGYDLIKPGQDYSDLFEAIKQLAQTWWHCLDSTWIVKTTLTVAQVRDQLQRHIDANDRLLVAELTGVLAWTGSFTEECSNWLRQNM